jgi:hypothetical protein
MRVFCAEGIPTEVIDDVHRVQAIVCQKGARPTPKSISKEVPAYKGGCPKK